MTKQVDNITHELTKIYDMAYKITLKEVNHIIENNITDQSTVEHCFDEILNIPTNKGYSLLFKLYNYYRSIDPKTADLYLKDYIENNDIIDLPLKTKKKRL